MRVHALPLGPPCVCRRACDRGAYLPPVALSVAPCRTAVTLAALGTGAVTVVGDVLHYSCDVTKVANSSSNTTMATLLVPLSMGAASAQAPALLSWSGFVADGAAVPGADPMTPSNTLQRVWMPATVALANTTVNGSIALTRVATPLNSTSAVTVCHRQVSGRVLELGIGCHGWEGRAMQKLNCLSCMPCIRCVVFGV